MSEVLYGFDNVDHYRKFRSVTNPYTGRKHYVRLRSKVTWNPYRKRQFVSYATHLPTAVAKTGRPLKWSQVVPRERHRYKRPEKAKKLSLEVKDDNVVKLKYAGFKRAFQRWVHGELENMRFRHRDKPWLKDSNFKVYNLLPAVIRSLLYKPRLGRVDIARFSAWLKSEESPPSLREYLFYSHYNKPIPFSDGSLPEEHEYFKFEDEINDFTNDQHESFKDLIEYNSGKKSARDDRLFKFEEGNQPSEHRYGTAILRSRRRLRPGSEVRYLIRSR